MSRSKGQKDPKAFVMEVERALARAGANDSLVNLTCRQIKAGNTPLLLRILEMRFGKPVQVNEHTGKDGERLKIEITEITHFVAPKDKAPA